MELSSSDKATVTKWGKWITNIYLECLRLFEYRYVFQELNKIVVDNTSLRNKRAILFNFIVEWFCDSALMSIRRMGDKSDDSNASLILLLDEISKKPQLITLDAYMKTHEGFLLGIPLFRRRDEAQEIEQEFRSLVNIINGHIDPNVVMKDKATVETASTRCKDLQHVG